MALKTDLRHHTKMINKLETKTREADNVQGKAILVATIKVKDLKLFYTRVGIKGQDQKSKKLECDVTAVAKVDPTFV